MNGSLDHPKRAFVLVLVVAVALLLVFAVVAAATPSSSEVCSDCHTAAGTAPTVSITSAVGVDPVQYSVHQTMGDWAAFDLSVSPAKRLAGGTTTDDTFTAALGHYVRVCAVTSGGGGCGIWSQAYYVTPTAKAGGAISPAVKELVAPGSTSKTYTITPSAGYHIADVTINGTSDPAAVASGSYTATNVTGDVAIVATFIEHLHHHVDGGPRRHHLALHAADRGQRRQCHFTMTANAGYQVASLLVDGAPVANATAYTFTDVTAVHTIAVTFVKPSLSLALSGLKSGAAKLHKAVTCKGAVNRRARARPP